MTNSNDLNLTIQHQLSQLVENTLRLPDILEEGFRRQSQILEENSEQIGRLTEGITETRLLIQEQGEIIKQTAEITKETAEINKQTAEIIKQNVEVAKQQAETIERLSRVVERQAATADRLSLMAEQFFRERQS